MTRTSRNGRGASARRRSTDSFSTQLRAMELGRWFNHALLLTALLTVLVIAWQAITALQQRPVRHITVTGDLEHTRPEEVQALVEPALDGGFLGADLALLRERLRQLPWVHDVIIWRRWPDGLEIHITEELPIARWRDNGLLNHQGRVFAPGDNQQWQWLPWLDGPEGSSRDLMVDYLRMNEQLIPQGLRLLALRNLGRGNLELQFHDGFTVVMQRERLAEQLQRFLAVYQVDLKHRNTPLQRVDMRYAHGMAVAFAEDRGLMVAAGNKP
jgi:cell division protein FtsQ